MKIAGIVKSSFIDYPGKASTVVFLGGCNFRCGYCHNPELVESRSPGPAEGHNAEPAGVRSREPAEGSNPEPVRAGARLKGPGTGDGTPPRIETEELLEFLKGRRRFLDAVCVSGGEPTVHEELPELLRQIRGLGLGVKLDTNGGRPRMLKALLEEGLADYVAMDVKGPLAAYDRIAGVPGMGPAVLESAGLLAASAAEFEFRTTVCREQLGEGELLEMKGDFPEPPRWFLQTFRDPGDILDRQGRYSPYSPAEMEALAAKTGMKLR